MNTTISIIRIIRGSLIGHESVFITDLGCGMPFVCRCLNIFWHGRVSRIDVPEGMFMYEYEYLLNFS